MGLAHLICAFLEADGLFFADIYGFHGCETLSTEMGSFSYAALASFAKLFAIVSRYYAQGCLKSIKCSFPENWGMQKKFDVTFFLKNISYHTFRPEKGNQSTFFTHKIAFYFSEISKFPEIDLLRKKKVLICCF